jgi:hypothetical protein
MTVAVLEDPTVNYQSADGEVFDVSITPKSQGDGGLWASGDGHTIFFHGPTDRGPNGTLTFNLSTSWTTGDLIGQKLHQKGVSNPVDCLPSSSQVAEPEVLAERVIRDDQGKLLFIAAPSTPTGADGKVFYTPELAPEVTIRWVRMPDEKCELRRAGLELTVVKTGKTAVAVWERRAELDIDGQTYVLVVANVGVPSGAPYCAHAEWNLYRKGLVHPI